MRDFAVWLAQAIVFSACIGVLYMVVAGVQGGEIMESKVTIGISIYTIVVLGIVCIWLHVESR